MNASGRPSVGIWPAIPRTVRGQPIPREFRGFRARVADPDRLLVEFIGWLENELPRPEESKHVTRTDQAASAAVRERGSAVRERDPAVREREQAVRDGATAQRQRGSLISAYLELTDRLTNEALLERSFSALKAVGVEPFHSDGEPFDKDRHSAVSRAPTSDSKLHNRVASTQLRGFTDNGQVLRRANVSVYRLDSG